MQQMTFVYEVKRENEEYSKLVQQVYHITLQITLMIKRWLSTNFSPRFYPTPNVIFFITTFFSVQNELTQLVATTLWSGLRL